MSPQAKRQGVRHLIEMHGYSERRACQLARIARSTARYKPKRSVEETVLRERVRQMASRHKAYGCPRITRLIRREGSVVNKKRIHRIWKAEGLQLPRRRPKKRRYRPRGEVIQRAEYQNHVWSYDFAEDRTENGGRLRLLPVLDEFTRECLAIHVAGSIPSADVVQLLDWLFLLHGSPEHLRSDNGPAFIANAVERWLAGGQCKPIYITPGSPWENPYIESFIGKLRQECLDRYLFVNVREAREIVENWRLEYNDFRPHSSLDYLTPVEFAAQQRPDAQQHAYAEQPSAPILSL